MLPLCRGHLPGIGGFTWDPVRFTGPLSEIDQLAALTAEGAPFMLCAPLYLTLAGWARYDVAHRLQQET